MPKPFAALLLLSTISFSSYAQKIANPKAVADGEKIVITYDIDEGYKEDKYIVNVYSSHNNFTTPINLVTGDVGPNVTEGKGKSVIWDSKAELGAEFVGALSFEIRAVIIAPLSFTSAITSTRRGKKMPIAWRGGNQNENVVIELLKQGEVQAELATIANLGSYAWTVPAKLKTGSDYQLRLKNGNEVIVASDFVVKRKWPLLLKFAPIAIGGAAILALSGSSGPSPLSTPPDLGLD